MARWAPPGMQMGGRLDPDTVEAATETPYDFKHQRVEWVRAETPGVTTLWWRGVGPTHNVFVVESAVDELAALAGQDPIAFRRGMLAGNARALGVLDAVTRASGWGTALPRGSGRGVALQFAFKTWMATVLQVAVGTDGEIRLERAQCRGGLRAGGQPRRGARAGPGWPDLRTDDGDVQRDHAGERSCQTEQLPTTTGCSA